MIRSAVVRLAALLLVAPAAGAAARTEPSAAARQEPPGIQTIYLVHTSHWDYGFTDPPQNLPLLVKAHLDNAVAKCLADTRHRYTIESVWMLEDYISVSTEAEVETLMSLVRQGRMALSSAYTSPHSGVMSAEELNRWIYRTKRLRERYQIPARAAHVNDNPGHSWAMPDALAGAGVDRLVAGCNTAFAEPFPLPRSESIFRWQGPGGGEVLTWVSRDGYLEGAEYWQIDANVARFFFGSQHPEWAGWTNQQIMQQGISEQVAQLEAAGYPYDAVLVLEAFDKMDYDPSGSLVADVARWNATHASPQIKLATADEFFDHMVTTYGWEAFPLRSGNWTQRWERAKAGSQMVHSRFREVRDTASAAEIFSTVASRFGASYPAAELDSAYRDLLRFDEHGGGCGGSQPGLMTIDEVHQNNLYWTQTSLARRDAMRGAVAEAVASVAHRIATGPDPEIVVFNSLSSARTDVVTARPEVGGQPFALRDAETNAAVPYQARADGSIEFVAQNVPAIGYKRYRVLVGSSDSWPNRVTTGATTVESAFYRVTVSATTGAITSIVDKTNGNRQLVNASSVHQFNRTVRASNLVDFFGGDPSQVATGTPSVAGSPGAVSGALVVELANPGGRNASPLRRVEIRLYDALKRIDVVDTHDRSRLQYTITADNHSEHFYQPFPFNIPIAQTQTLVDGNAAAMLRPPTETYLRSGSAVAVNNSLYPARGVVLRDAAASFDVQVVSPEVTLYSIGTSTNSYTYVPTEATLLAQCLQKMDRTVTDDPGNPELDFVIEPIETSPSVNHSVYTARFTITSGPSASASQTSAFGAAVLMPLQSALAPAGQAGTFSAPRLSFFSVAAPNVEVLTIKRAELGGASDVVVRVRERDGAATSTLLSTVFPVTAAFECTLLEEPVSELPAAFPSPLAFSIGAYETKTLRLRLAPPEGFAGDSVGIHAPSSGFWFLRNGNTPGPADVTTSYGPPNVTPVVGDWDGDGVDTLGVYDGAAGAFFLKNALAPGSADAVFFYGTPAAGWVPLAGDWDGDGRDTVGLYDPSSGAFFLKNSNSSGAADLTFFYGPPGAQPIVGDWDGDGVDTVGVYVAETGAFFLRNENAGGAADLTFFFGTGGGRATAGDWNGDGRDTIGLYVPDTAAFFLRDENSPGPASTAFPYGAPFATPLAGNWDGL